jgi:hypothetical protein
VVEGLGVFKLHGFLFALSVVSVSCSPRHLVFSPFGAISLI